MKNIIDKINFIEEVISKLENNKNVTVIDILKYELKSLIELNKENIQNIKNKKVVKKDDFLSYDKYHCQDGSIFVIKNNYKYFYDSNSKIITYEFNNGQIERTFPNGIKEVRHSDGSIFLKTNYNEYEYIEK